MAERTVEEMRTEAARIRALPGRPAVDRDADSWEQTAEIAERLELAAAASGRAASSSDKVARILGERLAPRRRARA